MNLATNLPENNRRSDLKIDSPHLFGVLNRLLSRDTSYPDSLLEIELAYSLAKKFGGNKELYFKRKAGSSFNPRAARIPLILLSGYPNAEYKEIILSILCSLLLEDDKNDCIISKTNQSKKSNKSDESESISEITKEKLLKKYLSEFTRIEKIRKFLSISAKSVNESPSHIENFPHDPTPSDIRILVSIFVDKIRHLHLASDYLNTEEMRLLTELCKNEGRTYIGLSGSFFPFYEPVINRWLSRQKDHFYSKQSSRL
ncbi:MAG TPA: hypothetical protein PKA63_06180 [Oligoflexia bacterium]|nr:hypothetical protein [Oligoflexia bacterium]HMP48237.1 hypothetical protein [Oligoflexia bacterium]